MRNGGSATLASAIKTEASRLGFDLAGITTPDPPAHLNVYHAWIEAGRHGAMRYLATERGRAARADPRLLLQDCASILVVGLRHPPSRREGPLAAYACAQDYHDVIPARLRELVAWLESQTGSSISHHITTDTGPILERELGQRAGLGWIGKNTCLIHPRMGSYFLLGEVLLAWQLPPDPPMRDERCGTCTRCQTACPTGCILPDRTLDASRCLSYLTIELRGDIPDALRSHLGPWVFGCDVCQRVCPWNERFAASPPPSAWPARPDLAALTARDLLQADSEQLRDWMQGTPLARARRRGLLRNAAVSAGNSGDRALTGSLATRLADTDPRVRLHAAWALGRLGGPAARAALAAAGASEGDPAVLEEIHLATRQAGSS
jgi:epoxyqueuosine reductase